MRTILIEKRINIFKGAMKGNVQSEMLFNNRVTVVFRKRKWIS